MSGQEIDLKKRRFLTQATSVVGAVGVGFVAWPFLSTWSPSAAAKAAGAPVDVDISKLEPGQLVRVLWRKKPVWIFRRDDQIISDLKTLESDLADPNNEQQQQPEYAKNPTRSIKPEIAVLLEFVLILVVHLPIVLKLVQLIWVVTHGREVFIAHAMDLNLT